MCWFATVFFTLVDPRNYEKNSLERRNPMGSGCTMLVRVRSHSDLVTQESVEPESLRI